MHDWDFLDEMDYNLLYSYAEVLGGKIKQIHTTCNNIATEAGDIREKEIAEVKLLQSRKKRALYLIWIVYRYILRCETYQDTIPYQNKETLSRFRIESYVRNHIYLGADKESEILPSGLVLTFPKIWFRDVGDISIILEILYNRYDFFDQFRCFIRNTNNLRKSRATEAFKTYINIINVMKVLVHP